MHVNREFTHFVKKTVLFVTVGILFAIVFVVIVDPYHIYGVVDQIGFNRVKPAIDRYQEQIKLIGAKRVNANALILGNSRAEIGFNPDDKMLSNEYYRSYNLAIPGSVIKTAQQQFDYMRSINKRPEVIILGLDFLDFLSDPNISNPSLMEGEKKADVDGFKWQFDAVFSLHSVTDALKTLQIQKSSEVETITEKGFNPLLEYNKYAREQGYYALFQQRAEENAKNYLRKRNFVIRPASDNAAHWRELRYILATAAEENIEVHLVIYPYHAQILFMFEQVGLMNRFDQWKVQLTKEMNDVKNKHGQSKSLLWDFSGYSPIQCELIPLKADKRTETKWYWEAGHFKAVLGSVMLHRMLDGSEIETNKEFGFALNSENIEANMQRLLNERNSCVNLHPELFRDAAQLIQEKL